MTAVGFYHLTARPLEWALPKLLEKILDQKQRAVVLVGVEQRVEVLADHLWTYDRAGFLPHGTQADGFAAEQPIWLTAIDENPNDAGHLLLVDGAWSEKMEQYTRVFDLFDGRDVEAVAAARRRWKACREAGHALTYWKQTPRGSWEKGA